MTDFNTRAKAIRLLILDVDGVCTDGKLYFGPEGEALKAFHVHDGLGMKLLQDSGVPIAIISARESKAVTHRMQALKVQYVFQGHENKLIAYEKLIQQLQLQDHEVAYLGDDLPDLPVVNKVGLGMAVANACDALKKAAFFVTEKKGGEGAVREVCDRIILAQANL